MTVILVTETNTKASEKGILFSIFIVGQAKVHITTINISHTKAARGIIAINDEANTIKTIKDTAADIQESLHLHPFDILIILCHIIAQPHIAPKNQHVVLAIH